MCEIKEQCTVFPGAPGQPPTRYEVKTFKIVRCQHPKCLTGLPNAAKGLGITDDMFEEDWAWLRDVKNRIIYE